MTSAASRQPPIWLLVFGLVIAASTVAIFKLESFEAVGRADWWIWPVAVAGFLIADSVVVNVHVRSETSAFTFIELPLFLAAIFVSPVIAWISMTCAIALSMFAVQRVPFAKATFNVANFSLQGAVGLWVFHEIVGSANPVGPQGWAAAAVAALVSSGLAAAMFVVVLFMVQGRDALNGVSITIFMSVLTAVTNVSLALIAASLIDYRPISLVLLLLPTVVLFGSYRAYTSERSQRDRVQAMHELALEVRSIRSQAGIAPVLRLAAEHLGAKNADLVLFPEQRGDGQAMRFFVNDDDEEISEVVSSELAAAVDAAHSMTQDDGDQTMDSTGQQLAGAIRGEGRALGLLRFDGRLRGDSEFSAGDVSMFNTIVEQLGLTFEKNQLGHAVSQLERRGRQLEHEAYHDDLTGLANRALLAAKLEAELSCNRSPSLLYVDLDDFKDVNDRYGHDAGDKVLVEISSRFASAVGANDCVARLGGDEFAVLLGEYSDDVGVANALLNIATEPIELANATVQVKASIGIARALDGIDASTLLKRADVAMYSAKEQGKGTLAVA